MFDRWRKARWTHVPYWLPIKNRRHGDKKEPQRKSFKEQKHLKSQSLEIRVRGEGEEGWSGSPIRSRIIVQVPGLIFALTFLAVDSCSINRR